MQSVEACFYSGWMTSGQRTCLTLKMFREARHARLLTNPKSCKATTASPNTIFRGIHRGIMTSTVTWLFCITSSVSFTASLPQNCYFCVQFNKGRLPRPTAYMQWMPLLGGKIYYLWHAHFYLKCVDTSGNKPNFSHTGQLEGFKAWGGGGGWHL